MFTIDLAGKTALVTGAGQGLGRCTATTLHRCGANVVVNYFEDQQGINRACAEETVASLGERAIAVAADVRNSAEIHRMVDRTVEQFGKLDIVVNNAAVIRDRTLKKMTDDEWQTVIDTNLTGVFQVCRAAADRLAEGPDCRMKKLLNVNRKLNLINVNRQVCLIAINGVVYFQSVI